MEQTDQNNNVHIIIDHIDAKSPVIKEKETNKQVTTSGFSSELDNSSEVIDHKFHFQKMCRSYSDTTIESPRSNITTDIFSLNVISKEKLLNSPIMKCNKKVCDSSDSEDNKKKKYYSPYHHESFYTSSSDESENNSIKGKKINKKYNNYSKRKSKSISENKRSSGNFHVVKEEKNEDEMDINSETRNILHNLGNKLKEEIHDNVVESYLDKRFRCMSLSTKCFKFMDPVDPVIEEKEEIDNYKQTAPFKKLKFVHDIDEDNKIKFHSNSLIMHNYEWCEAIEEDYREDDIDNAERKKKKKKSKFPDFIDKSDINEELYKNKEKNYITEEIKEELEDNINEQNEELIYRKNRPESKNL